MTEINPFECPVCFDQYNDVNNLPTTLPCGHSCCLSHVNQLTNCFHCRRLIPAHNQCYPSFALRDGAILYGKLVLRLNTIADSAAIIPTTSATVYSSAAQTQAAVDADAKFARELAKAWELEEKNATSRKRFIQPKTVSRNVITVASRTQIRIQTETRQIKSCGHTCTFSSLQGCCACMDRRPTIPEGTYPKYKDGHGWVNDAVRSEGYCPFCK